MFECSIYVKRLFENDVARVEIPYKQGYFPFLPTLFFLYSQRAKNLARNNNPKVGSKRGGTKQGRIHSQKSNRRPRVSFLFFSSLVAITTTAAGRSKNPFLTAALNRADYWSCSYHRRYFRNLGDYGLLLFIRLCIEQYQETSY